MNAKVIFGLFMAVAAAQVAVPLGQVWKYEDVLRTGKAYKFRTAPVDPYDAFRGRYVALNYDGTSAPVRKGDRLEYRRPAYVSLGQDTNGFAVFGELSAQPPVTGAYVRVEYLYPNWTNTSTATFRLPFDKFFMEETAAPQAEEAYRRQGRGAPNAVAYAAVRVKNGRGVIEDLYLQGKPIREFLAKEATKR
jgi:uncharacterized membrane-anchored protein